MTGAQHGRSSLAPARREASGGWETKEGRGEMPTSPPWRTRMATPPWGRVASDLQAGAKTGCRPRRLHASAASFRLWSETKRVSCKNNTRQLLNLPLSRSGRTELQESPLKVHIGKLIAESGSTIEDKTWYSLVSAGRRLVLPAQPVVHRVRRAALPLGRSASGSPRRGRFGVR
eukprot:5897922-Pyramimonas_sp.AAC.1